MQPHGYPRFEILLPVIARCKSDLKRAPSTALLARCLVARPCTRARHRRQEAGFSSRRISRITALSFSPNWARMASKGVRSSQAISITRSVCWAVRDSVMGTKKAAPANYRGGFLYKVFGRISVHQRVLNWLFILVFCRLPSAAICCVFSHKWLCQIKRAIRPSCRAQRSISQTSVNQSFNNPREMLRCALHDDLTV